MTYGYWFLRIVLNPSTPKHLQNMSSCCEIVIPDVFFHVCWLITKHPNRGFQEGFQVSSPIGPRFERFFFLGFCCEGHHWTPGAQRTELVDKQPIFANTRWALTLTINHTQVVPWGCTKLSSCNVLEGSFGSSFAGVVWGNHLAACLNIWIIPTCSKRYWWWFRNPASTSWYGESTIIYRVLPISGGCLRFLQSTVLSLWGSKTRPLHFRVHEIC